MSNPDAVRPTGETGETRPSERSCHLAAQAWCRPETSDRAMDVKLAEAFARILDEQLGPRMPWSEMSGSEKEAVYNNAPRPLDFPAGAPGPWRKSDRADHFPNHIHDVNGVMVAVVSYNKEIPMEPKSPEEIESIREHIISRCNAPARPAAAGMTGELAIHQEPPVALALTHRDYMEIIHEDPDSNLPYSGHVSEIVERAVAFARRHATIRRGGGE